LSHAGHTTVPTGAGLAGEQTANVPTLNSHKRKILSALPDHKAVRSLSE
jgi:hypothetical protein